MKSEINLLELASFIKKKIIFIATLCLLGLGISAAYTFYFAVPMYSSTTQLLVDQRRGDENALNTGDINANIQLIDTYKELINGPAILEKVRAQLDTDVPISELAEKIEVEAPQNVQVFNITVTETDPYQAEEMTNTVAEVFSKEIREIMPRIDSVSVIYEGVPKLTPVSPNVQKNLIIGFLIGFLGSFGIVVLQHLLDGTVRTTEFITEEIGWNDLGAISVVGEDQSESFEKTSKKDSKDYNSVERSMSKV